MAFTSNKSNAGSDDSKDILLVVNGKHSLKRLPDLKGDDYLSNKGDLWKLSMTDFFGFTNCISTREIQKIAVVNSGSDRWNIDSIVTYAVYDQYFYEQSSVDLDIFRWVDSAEASQEEFQLTVTL